MKIRDPYWKSFALTMTGWWGTAALLAWLASRWPLRFGVGVLLFFLLIYGKLNFVVRPFRRLLRRGCGGSAPAPKREEEEGT